MRNPNDDNQRTLPRRWVGCSIEEEYFGDERKSLKMDRKIATAKDRSKYKKTDRGKVKKRGSKVDKTGLLRGRVLSITPQGIVVDSAGENFICSLRGVLKKEKSQLKNLVVVGDWVLFERSAGNEGFIAQIEPRQTILSRADNLSRRKEQLIAANIDQVMITVSVVAPPLKPFLVDRYIIAARMGGMTPIIVVNKIDLLDDPEQDPVLLEQERSLYEEFLKAYVAAGITVIVTSASREQGMSALQQLMQDKASVFSGQSGVGKSSLINALTDLELKVGDIVVKTGKGAQTTTTTNLLPLPFGGWCIDTPGIKSFGLWDLKKEEIEQYFSEIYTCGRNCRYPDCNHLEEQDCAVLAAVETGEISPLRYQSFQYLIESVSRKHLRR